MAICDVLGRFNITEYCVVPIKNEFVIYPHKLEGVGFSHDTAIVCLFSYFVSRYPKNAVLSRYAACPDYHHVIRRVLSGVCTQLCALYPGFRFSYYTDDSPYSEKDMAAFGGLIIRGKNDIGLSQKFGQLFFIGEIVTDAPIAHEYRTPPVCCKDAPCLRACPTGAINENGFERTRCLSHISQKIGREFSDADAALFARARYAWGCDICLNACPKNKSQDDTPIKELHDIAPYISIEEICGLSNREYREKYRGRVFAGRGKAAMMRNLRHLKENNKWNF
ncbi:MAG: epoxyqueuosine reductase [Clostridia bacterium]|nr:epoxyqueuosine reductase [Clostridia bacterium]